MLPKDSKCCFNCDMEKSL